jgi:hypothetical protein
VDHAHNGDSLGGEDEERLEVGSRRLKGMSDTVLFDAQIFREAGPLAREG